MSGPARPLPAHVPTLTEVIDLHAPQQPPRTPPIPLDALPVLGDVLKEATTPPEPTEAQLAHRVLADVQKQVDGMLEFRLREAIGPVLARHTEAMVRELRDELNRTLRDVVARSVAQELAKLRQR